MFCGVIGSHGRCLSRGGTRLEGGLLGGYLEGKSGCVIGVEALLGSPLKRELNLLTGLLGTLPIPGHRPLWRRVWRGARDLGPGDLASSSDSDVDSCVLE